MRLGMRTKQDTPMSAAGKRTGVALFPELGLAGRQPGLGNRDDEFRFRHAKFEDTARHREGSFPGGD